MSVVSRTSEVPQPNAGTYPPGQRQPERDPATVKPGRGVQPVLGATGATREAVSTRTPAEISSTAAAKGVEADPDPEQGE